MDVPGAVPRLAGSDAVPPMVRTAPPRMEAHVPTVDRQEFELAALAMAQAAHKCRDARGLLIQPPDRVYQQSLAAVRGALTHMFGVPVHVQDEQTIFGLPKEDPP